MQLSKKFTLSLFGLFGLAVFSLNSSSDLNFIIKGYLTLLDLKLGILIIYFLFNFSRKSFIFNKKRMVVRLKID
jgi:hypothetical protein